jgi:4'-phosphopantetheinyl transferase EntD
MIESILPTCVVSVDAFNDPPEATLYAAEEQLISRAVEHRRREFTTARHCARGALRLLGRPATAILAGQRGEPRWPDGVVGSITHCDGYRGAVLGDCDRVTSVGIDAEPNQPMTAGVLEAVSLPDERVTVGVLARSHPHVAWDRLLFSAKESVYKAWYPLTHRWLDFEEARVTVDPQKGVFTARLLVPGPRVDGRQLTAFTGRWLVQNGLIVTAIVLPAPVVLRRPMPAVAGAPATV